MSFPAKLLKLIFAVAFALVAYALSRPAHAAGGPVPVLVIYAYDSLAGKGALGPDVVARFTKKRAAEKKPVKVELVSVGDGAQILSRLKLDRERGKPRAHLVWGIDENVFTRMKADVLPLDPASFIRPAKFAPAIGRPATGFVPFDYGVFAFMQDTKKLAFEKRPLDWDDLLDARFKKSLILEDPRTSTPGLAFVGGTLARIAEKEPAKRSAAFRSYWKRLKPQWLTLSPGWSQAYGMFLKAEAPLVWSYVTSEAYHRENGDATSRYRAIVFESGNPLQIEGLAIPKDAPGGEAMAALAREFVGEVLSVETQTALPKLQWMMPAREGVKLPPSFEALPRPRNLFPALPSSGILEQTLKDWNAAIR